MPFKRPPPARSSSVESYRGDGSTSPPAKLARLISPGPSDSPDTTTPLKVYIVPAKLEPERLVQLHRLVELGAITIDGAGRAGDGESKAKADDKNPYIHTANLELILAGDAREAEVIVTAVRMRQRLERHVEWDLAKTKAIVTPQWLEDSVSRGRLMSCGDYAALSDLREVTVEHCPDHRTTPPEFKSDANASASASSPPRAPSSPTWKHPDDIPQQSDTSLLTHTSRYACCRASPLVCPNQGLIRQLDIIKQERNLEGEERSMLSYARAISIIKAYPHIITLANLKQEVSKLPHLGKKLSSMIEEYLKTGSISETQKILASTRFQSLSAFATIHGVGPHTARKLYNLGLRTLEDLEKYYEVEPGRCVQETLAVIEAAGKESEEAAVERSIKVALALRHDFSQTIPRAEVEELNRVIMAELEEIEKGCVSVIVGGYRRGKPQSNDVDIVICHQDWESGAGKIQGLSKRFVGRLCERGLLTHVMHLSGFHAHNALRTHHWDSLEKALAVFVLPQNGAQRRIYRRLDLIFAAPEVFWTAVVGWSGSTMFERDLRLYAKQQKGLKFDSSGITRRRDSKLYFPKSEREAFELLGLTYVHPTLRNADA